MKMPKMPKVHGGGMQKSTTDLSPHPYYKTGKVPTRGNRVTDMGLADNFNAPTRGEVNAPGGKYPRSMKKAREE